MPPQGLGFPEISVGKVLPPFQNMLEQKLLSEPVFSFWLNRQPDEGGEGEGGEMVLGGVDPDHFKGEHTWCGGWGASVQRRKMKAAWVTPPGRSCRRRAAWRLGRG